MEFYQLVLNPTLQFHPQKQMFVAGELGIKDKTQTPNLSFLYVAILHNDEV